VWPDNPTKDTWDKLRAAIPGNHILGYRPRGGFGDFDSPLIRDMDEAKTVPIYSTNLNPRVGDGSNKLPISLKDWAGGRYDDSVLRPGGQQLMELSPFVRRIIVEIWSEVNVAHPPPDVQPEPPDWSTANWEAAFTHTVDLWRSMGVQKNVWLGCSVAGVQKDFGEYHPPGVLSHSNYVGFDFYANTTSFKLMSERASKIRAFATANGLPIIFTESGVEETADYKTWFDDAYAFITSGGVAGQFYTDYSSRGDFRVDPGQPMHSTFASYASQPGWKP
jgi:hypothetical protein